MMRPRASASRAGIAGMKRTALARPRRSTCACSASRSGPVADQRGGDAAAAALELGDRVDQHVDAFDRPQLAHEDEIGRVGPRHDRARIPRATRRCARRAPARAACRSSAENVGAVGALEQEQVAAQHQQSLGASDKTFRPACRGRTAGCRHAAYRRAPRAGCRTRAGHRRRPWRRGRARRRHCVCAMRRIDMRQRGQVAGIGMAAHRNAGEAERERRPSCRKASSARAPPVLLSAISPTRCPRAACSAVRSRHGGIGRRPARGTRAGYSRASSRIRDRSKAGCDD